MSDLHEAGDRRYTAQIDSTGWIFAAVVVVITAVAGIVAYYGSDLMVPSNLMAQVASR
jgi:hypothetical protein